MNTIHSVIFEGKVIKHFTTIDGLHMLMVNAVESPWMKYEEIAKCESYYAATNYWTGQFPEIFKVDVLLDFNTQ